MVCNRCKLVLKSELEKLGLHPVAIELGEVEIQEDNIEELKEVLIEKFDSLGFELLDDKQSKTIEKVKNLIIELVHYNNNNSKFNLSAYLSPHFSQDYNSLSHLFSEVEGRTIESYFISQKIEKVKEFLMYGELTLGEIAHQLNYSSVAHLSNQFKKVTGLTPTFFKNLGDKSRSQIDKL